MQQHVLFEGQVAGIEDGLFNHALQQVQLALQPLEGDEAAQLAELLPVAPEQGQLQLAGHTQRGLGTHVGISIPVAPRPKANPKHAHVEPLPVRPAERIGHPGTQRAAGLEEDVLEVPDLADCLFVRRGRFALEKWRESELMQTLADVDQVVVFHRQGQIGDDRQDVAGIELRGVRREDHPHGVFGQHGTHLVFEPVATHALHETAKRFGPAHVVELGVSGILEGVDEHHLALDVLNDAEQQGRAFFGVMLALPLQELGQDVVGRVASLQPHVTRLLQQRNPQARLPNAIQRQRQENPVEHLVRVAHHRLIILLLTHDGCKVTSYF